MVSTVQFSQFPNAVVGDPTNIPVGLGAGLNTQIPRYQWTTLTRPATPYDGLLGYNTDIHQYEYWDVATSIWQQLLISSSGANWSVVTTSSVATTVNSGYVANRSATPINFLLPATMGVGDLIEIMGLGSAGWSLIANTGQQIIFGNQTSSVAGSWSSTLQSDSVIVRGIVPNTLWNVVGGVGNLTIA